MWNSETFRSRLAYYKRQMRDVKLWVEMEGFVRKVNRGAASTETSWSQSDTVENPADVRAFRIGRRNEASMEIRSGGWRNVVPKHTLGLAASALLTYTSVIYHIIRYKFIVLYCTAEVSTTVLPFYINTALPDGRNYRPKHAVVNVRSRCIYLLT